MSHQPLISIIVPCYNQGIYLSAALQSIYEQTISNWECLIINDGATDDTEKIAQQWLQKDYRFKYFYKQNGGLSSARNKGLEEARGAYIQFLDADDMITANKFEASLKESATATVIISNFKMFTNKKEVYSDPALSLNKNHFNFENILTGWDEQFAIPIHCALFKSHLFKTIRFNESLKAREDWLMWLQIYQLNIETVFINEPYALYRYSPDSMSQNKSLMNYNLVVAYQIIYEILPVLHRDILYKKATTHLGRLLEETTTILQKTRQSKSYRIGNFFVRNFNKLFNRKIAFILF